MKNTINIIAVIMLSSTFLITVYDHLAGNIQNHYFIVVEGVGFLLSIVLGFGAGHVKDKEKKGDYR